MNNLVETIDKIITESVEDIVSSNIASLLKKLDFSSLIKQKQSSPKFPIETVGRSYVFRKIKGLGNYRNFKN